MYSQAAKQKMHQEIIEEVTSEAQEAALVARRVKKLAPKTDQIVKDSIFFQGPCADFVTRQQTFEDAREQRREVQRNIGTFFGVFVVLYQTA